MLRKSLDPLVVTDLVTMAKKSRECNHLAMIHTNRYTHERTPRTGP